MRLYKPIFFGEADATSQFESETIQEELNPEVKTEEVKIEKPKEETPAKKSSVASQVNSATYLEGLIRDYRKNVLSKRKYRNDVVVRYYRHEPDGDQVSVLSQYGFYIHERPIPDEKRFKDFGSNVIYYGHDFPESDLKFIAALLISNGMEIKSIQPFKDFDGWKHKSIEIGANTKLDKRKALTLDDIQAFRVSN